MQKPSWWSEILLWMLHSEHSTEIDGGYDPSGKVHWWQAAPLPMESWSRSLWPGSLYRELVRVCSWKGLEQSRRERSWATRCSVLGFGLEPQGSQGCEPGTRSRLSLKTSSRETFLHTAWEKPTVLWDVSTLACGTQAAPSLSRPLPTATHLRHLINVTHLHTVFNGSHFVLHVSLSFRYRRTL